MVAIKRNTRQFSVDVTRKKCSHRKENTHTCTHTQTTHMHIHIDTHTLSVDMIRTKAWSP